MDLDPSLSHPFALSPFRSLTLSLSNPFALSPSLSPPSLTLSFPPSLPPTPPPPRLSTETRNRSSGIKAAVLSSAAAGAALGLANHYSPAFRAALGPSGRAAMVALPALGVVFLEVEWKINACAMRQRYADKPTAVEPEDILPKRSG